MTQRERERERIKGGGGEREKKGISERCCNKRCVSYTFMCVTLSATYLIASACKIHPHFISTCHVMDLH